MVVEGRNFNPPASAGAIAALREVLPRDTPSDYFEFLAIADGAQVWYEADKDSDFDCIRIYSVSRMLEMHASLQELFPALVVIGSDQGSQRVGFDLSVGAPWPIVMHLPGWGTIKLASSFTELSHRYLREVGAMVTHYSAA